jgi:hypothetical protein
VLVGMFLLAVIVVFDERPSQGIEQGKGWNVKGKTKKKAKKKNKSLRE